MNFISGASINSIKDKDLFAIFEYRKWKYTFYMNFFGIQRNIPNFKSYSDVDGNGEYTPGADFKITEVDVDIPLSELYEDWNQMSDNYGVVRA